MKTHAAKLIAFRTLLKTSDFFTPAAIKIVIKTVIILARKSGGRPETKRNNSF